MPREGGDRPNRKAARLKYTSARRGLAASRAEVEKRLGRACEDLDTVLMMLCANESRFINGAIVQADDGFAV